MILPSLSALSEALPRHGRLMGLDVGEKTIGLALSDVMRMVATPLQTIRRTKFSKDMEILAALIRQHEVGALVLGYPRNMDGSEGPRCQSIRQFAANVEKYFDSLHSSSPRMRGSQAAGKTPEIPATMPATAKAVGGDNGSIPILFWDERLSTAAVERVMLEADLSRARRAELVDKMAAAYILQGALDGLSRLE